ncbi:MAG TPA: bifunctional UDP-N-acetylmuramoyl-tripeptide:D-alanyl-D-alanine ligase/alanine racemase, partial [Bacteroidetes bacterium]|nr:bifunctional UDP-N-acetylmuramoyl-tripeptide:D-alanyl-D-alanine ligase/alanine racemase [Bacteroidota bacterium]
MHKYAVKDIAKIIKAERIIHPEICAEVEHILLDSRNSETVQNTLFIAIKGKRHDGHEFIPDLYKKGIHAFVISNDKINTENHPKAVFLVVKNSLKALQLLAAYHRQKFSIPVVGITGSNGKTIVKEWLYQLLYKDLRVIRSPKSYNSQIGVPLSVLEMKKEHQMAVFEAGISEADEMQALKTIIEPTIGIFTNIGSAHDENFFNKKHKVGEKLKLFTAVEHIIYCSDYSQIHQSLIQSSLPEKIKIFSWGKTADATLQIIDIKKKQKQSEITAIHHQKQLSICIPFTDDASIENAIHCWAFMLLQQYSPQEISKRMLHLIPVAMRLEMKNGINNCAIINDYYNSDIKSLEIALDFQKQQSQNQKKTLILSDILQSGREAEELYGEVAKMIKERGISKLIGIGNEIKQQQALFDLKKKYFFKTTDEFIEEYAFNDFQNENILLKAARVFAFENISKELQEKSHETVFEINLNALVHNLNYFRNKLDKNTKIMAMLKAFSYGSGSYEIAKLLEFHKIDYIAVAYIDEGVELRKAGIKTPIMIMNPENEGLLSCIKYQLEPEIYSFRILKQLLQTISDKDKVKIHIKIDTGMHRLGFEAEEIDRLIQMLLSKKNIQIQSVFSHLAASDNPKHKDFTLKQIEKLEKTKEIFSKNFNYPIDYHILNSSGINRYSEYQMDMVRLGIGLYGISNEADIQEKLLQVGKLKTHISQIKTIQKGKSIGYNLQGKATKDTIIATI